MRKQRVKFLVQGFLFWGCLGLVACGKGAGNGNDNLTIQLSIPADERPESFWFGVEQREIHLVQGNGEEVIFAWEPGMEKEVALRQGDRVEFWGKDKLGRILVRGSSGITSGKLVSVSLIRVL